MKRPLPDPPFLARQSYRRRRLSDAAKVLPVVALVFFLLPILWASTARTAGSGIYLFLVWGLLICAVAIVTRLLVDSGAEDQHPPPGDETG